MCIRDSHKALPSLFERPALTRINDPSWAYDDIEDAARGENGTLFAAFVALTAAAARALGTFPLRFLRLLPDALHAAVSSATTNNTAIAFPSLPTPPSPSASVFATAAASAATRLAPNFAAPAAAAVSATNAANSVPFSTLSLIDI